MLELRRDHVRRLRRVGPAGDALALRRTLERSLAGAELAPATLPRGAIVCVRRLRLSSAGRGEPLAARAASELAALLPGMAEPLRGPVPANADAVLFRDEAELLACLARDRARGAGTAWWWQALFPGTPADELVARELAAAPERLPAVLELLAEQGWAVPVLEQLPTAVCHALAGAVAAAFGVTGWAQPELPLGVPPAAGHPPGRRAPTAREQAPAELSRLEPLLPLAAAALEAPRRTLLGLALVLRRAPALVRRAEVVAALRAGKWPAAVRDRPPEPAPAAAAGAPAAPQPSAQPAETPAGRGGAAGMAAGAASAPGAVVRARGPAGAPLVAEPPRAGVETSPGPAPAGGPAPPPQPAPPQQPALSPAERASARAGGSPGWQRRRAEPQVAAPLPHFVESAYAGVLYLVNLALFLELYGDFTHPERAAPALALGDFLALVGLEVCGAALREDPLWRICALLAGREPEQPPPEDEGTRAELSRLLPLLERRAARALGLESAALAFLCRRPGRISLTPLRLEAVFALAEHPLAVRLAGLDRDPGWVPAAGRIVEFRYE